jgi:hypothetical protein
MSHEFTSPKSDTCVETRATETGSSFFIESLTTESWMRRDSPLRHERLFHAPETPVKRDLRRTFANPTPM